MSYTPQESFKLFSEPNSESEPAQPQEQSQDNIFKGSDMIDNRSSVSNYLDDDVYRQKIEA